MADQRPTESEAERQQCWRVPMPPDKSFRLGRSQMPFVPQAKRQHGLKGESVLRSPARRRVSERDRILSYESQQEAGNAAAIDGAESGTAC